MFNKWVCVFSTFLLLACNAQNQSITNGINFKTDSLLVSGIAFENLDKYKFTCYTANYNINKDSSLSLLYLVNNSNIIDFNIFNGQIEKIEIPGGYSNISSILSLNKNDFFYSLLNDNSDLNLYYVDTLKNMSLKLNELGSFKDNGIFVGSELGFGYRLPIINDSEIIFYVLDDKNKGNTIAKYNIETNSTSFYKFKLTKDFSRYCHPLRNSVKFELLGDSLFLNYEFSEKVDLFSLSKNKYLNSLKLKSKFQTNDIPALANYNNDFENERYPIEAGYYSRLTYNPYKKCYYRLYYHDLPRLNGDGLYTIVSDKQVSLVVFDQNFDWIGECIIDAKNYFAGIVPHPEGALSLFGNRHGENYYLSLVKHD